MLQRVRDIGVWENTVFRQILMGTCDEGSVLTKLRGQRDILILIFDATIDMWRSHLDHNEDAFRLVRTVKFPEWSGINVNLMPFVMGQKDTLPEDLHGYWPIIRACQRAGRNTEYGKVCYLTIDESQVEEGQSQRRGGIHIDAPGRSVQAGSGGMEPIYDAHGAGVVVGQKLVGGIYTVSNIPNSSRIYPYKVIKKEEIAGPVGHGGVERLRGLLGDGGIIPENMLCWFTDVTPHESLPLFNGDEKRRQFFRLITSDNSFWWQTHSSPNPLGVKPGPNTKIVVGDRFGDPNDIVILDPETEVGVVDDGGNEATFCWCG